MNQMMNVPDNELIARIREGDELAEDVLATRYVQLVKKCARPYFLAGGDHEDLIQEGMFGLLNAIRHFDPDMGVVFPVYAEQCIRNRLLTAIESASRFKHAPLNDGISFEYLLSEEPKTLQTHYDDSFRRNTEETVLAKECEEELLVHNAKQLSKFEKEVL